MKKAFVLCTVLIICLTGCVYAGNLVKKVYFSPYPIIIDDEEYSSEMPILSYQDRTYVALREFSEMVGVKIDFVDDTIIIETSDDDIKNNKEKLESIISSEKVNEIVEDESELIKETEITTKSEMVYITQTGTKYHVKSNCSKGNYYTTTLEMAIKDGYTPCKRCVK